MTNDNKVQGNKFEARLATMLYQNHFWTHRFVQGAGGQPCDIIAAKNGTALLIDCKRCYSDTFNMERIEPNQLTAMSAWQYKTGFKAWFALLMKDGIYMVEFSDVQAWVNLNCFTQENLRAAMIPFEDWLVRYQ